LDFDSCGGALDLAKIVRRKLEVRGPDVLDQALQLRGPGDVDDPGLLGQQPGERDLCRGRLLPRRDPGQQIDQGLIRLQPARLISIDVLLSMPVASPSPLLASCSLAEGRDDPKRGKVAGPTARST
jgi:hypothetical protein